MQTAETIDIRKVRTRKSIIDSFIELMQLKKFDSIRVSDITERAMINRATFYYHFADKYELFEVVTKESVLKNVQIELKENTQFCENTLKNIFLSLTEFHSSLSNMCTKSYNEMASQTESILRSEVEQVLSEVLKNELSNKTPEEIKSTSSLLSWMLYGAAYDWKTSQIEPEVYFDQTMSMFKNIINQ